MHLTTSQNSSVIRSYVSQQIEHVSSWVEIDTNAFTYNLKIYKSLIGNALLAPVIKSNAYGHGIELIAQLCEKSVYVDWICVVSVQEALILRNIGITKPLLVTSILNGDLAAAIAYNVDVVIYDWQTASLVSALAQQQQKMTSVHIKIDTGLSRLGVLWDEATTFIKAIAQLPYISIRAVFTHFADVEKEINTFYQPQVRRFNDFLAQLTTMGISVPLYHASSTAATNTLSHCHFSLVRTGIGIYGLWPSAKNKQRMLTERADFHIRPILTWKTRIIQIKKIPTGSYVGYDCTYCAPHAMTIAILPVGYWDGYRRELSNKGSVLIHDTLARQVGRVSMNLLIIDITGIKASVGDEVVLLGNHAQITADDMALHCGTINYEIVTQINPLLPRIAV